MTKYPLMNNYLTQVTPIECLGWVYFFFYHLLQADRRGKGKESPYNKAKGEKAVLIYADVSLKTRKYRSKHQHYITYLFFV